MIEKVSPVKPCSIKETKKPTIPDEVIQVFNSLIDGNRSDYDGSSSFKQEDVVRLLIEDGFSREEIFENHWLDVEAVYRKAGWNVEYDCPGYNEGYPAKFTFSKRTRWRKVIEALLS